MTRRKSSTLWASRPGDRMLWLREASLGTHPQSAVILARDQAMIFAMGSRGRPLWCEPPARYRRRDRRGT
jgi:hypothetical protein